MTEHCDERMRVLEKRVAELEEFIQGIRLREKLRAEGEAKVEVMVEELGEYIDKTTAALVLGVTRTTVYTMLRDGRLEGACGGKKVDVRSIARYLRSPRKMKGNTHESNA